MSDLTVISVAANDTGIIDRMIRSVYKFTDPKPKIIICDNGNNGTTLDKYRDDDNIRIFYSFLKIFFCKKFLAFNAIF